MAIDCKVPQGPSVINQTLVPNAGYGSSDATNWFPVDFFSAADITLVVGTASGTSNVYVQKLLPDNATPMDIASFPASSTGAFSLAFVNGGNTIRQATDATMTTSTTIVTNFGSMWRIKFVIGAAGVTTFGVYGNFQQ